MKNSPNTDGQDTLTSLPDPVTLPIIIEARPDRVLVRLRPLRGTGRTVGEAMDELARRMRRHTAPSDELGANEYDRATDEA